MAAGQQLVEQLEEVEAGWHAELLAVAERVLRDSAKAAAVLQDAFAAILALDPPPTFRSADIAKRYLKRSVRRRALNRRRDDAVREKRRTPNPDAELLQSLPGQLNIEELSIEEERREILAFHVRETRRGLPQKLRGVCKLLEDGKKSKEIAAESNVDVRTAERWVAEIKATFICAFEDAGIHIRRAGPRGGQGDNSMPLR